MAETTGIFICPSCQAVVKGGPSGLKGLVCPECEHDFEIGQDGDTSKNSTSVPNGRSGGSRSTSVIRDLTAKKAPPVRPVEVNSAPLVPSKTLEEAQAEGGNGGVDEEIIMPDGTRRVRRRKRKQKTEKNKSLVFFLLGWICLVLILLAYFKMKNGGEDTDASGDDSVTEADKDARDRAVMRRLLPEIGKKFQEFLFHPTINGREQFIDRSADLSLAFSDFYTANVFPRPESQIRLVNKNVLSFPDDEIAIETIWEDEGGVRWGAVHVFDKTEGWRLDWENFGPLSSESWAKFRSNLGGAEGVFRLLVRKRLASNEEESVFLSFYRAPQVFEAKSEFKNTESPEVDVKIDSETGRTFLKQWGDYLDGQAPYGSILAKELDPGNHMRITVRLAWEKNSLDEDEMVLKEIIGVGWFGEAIQELHKKAVRKVTDEATEKLSEGVLEGS